MDFNVVGKIQWKAHEKRLIDTYDALVGFMQLADVNPEEVTTKQNKSS